MRKALTIAGSDSGGGAGIQADLKTFQELHVFGMSAITAVTAQNTLGVQGVYPLSPEAVGHQMDSIAQDLNPDAVKLGMLFSREIIKVIIKRLRQYNWSRYLVIDPVMVAKGGSPLLQQDAMSALIRDLLPSAYVVTPNIPETEAIIGEKLFSMEDRRIAAKKIAELGVRNVVIKGGHGDGEVVIDLLYDGTHFYEYSSDRIKTKNTHGTGCTFAAAITAELAKGEEIQQSVETAKKFVTAAIKDELHKVGGGHGPTNHWAYRNRGGYSNEGLD